MTDSRTIAIKSKHSYWTLDRYRVEQKSCRAEWMRLFFKIWSLLNLSDSLHVYFGTQIRKDQMPLALAYFFGKFWIYFGYILDIFWKVLIHPSIHLIKRASSWQVWYQLVFILKYLYRSCKLKYHFVYLFGCSNNKILLF